MRSENMRQSQGPDETESRRLTPSIGLAHDSEQPADSTANEDFLFHLYRGSELLQDNRVHEAKEELERALHLQPRDSKGQDLLAVVYFRLGLYPRAIQIYEQLRKKNVTDTALLLNLALCYLKTGQPQLARRDLEQLLALNSTHSRAWGYLGLACERLGDLAQAERAFQNGGHGQMAKRIAARRDATAPADEVASSQPSKEVRDVAGAAYQELDAGELSFALAEPSSEKSIDEAAGQSWRPHELGSVRPSDRAADIASVRPAPIGQVSETAKPDTKDGQRGELGSLADPPIVPSVPQLGIPQSLNRRPTLIAPVGAPPAHEYDPHGALGGLASREQQKASEFAQVERIPSHQPPSFSLDDAGIPAGVAAAAAAGVASMRRPVVAVPSPFGPPKSHEQSPINELQRTRTLPPPLGPGSAPPTAEPLPAAADLAIGSASPSTPLGIGPLPPGPVSASVKPETPRVPSGSYVQLEAPEISEPRLSEAIRFPDAGVVLHASGVALVQTTEEIGFAARLEAIRAQQSGLQMKLLERNMKGKSTGESFGGVTSPMVIATGDGQLVLAPRPGRKLAAFVVGANEMCFAREDVLLGFGAGLVFENGRLSTGENEFVPVVQLRGEGAVLLEAMGAVITLPVHADRSLNVRREVILGWYGRLVPRAVAPKDAPCGQRGLVSFAGEGRVLITSA
jgi:uncharacterized protein (AIM24 family)